MIKLGLIGFGTVAKGLCELLQEKETQLQKLTGDEIVVTAISDFKKGAVYVPEGIDLNKLLEIDASGESIDTYEGLPGQSVDRGWDSLKTIRESNADIICEMTYTDVKTGQPAIDHVEAALNSGKHVVTSNKGPAALKWRELSALAEENKVAFRIEGTVMSGTPVLNLAEGPLAGCEITAIRGILNGTTNYILSEMETGKPYVDALKQAQELGYAEADPTGDVEGFDALAKVLILANTVMGANLVADNIKREGITGITPEMIREAGNENQRWKLIGSIQSGSDGIVASVAPEKVPMTHPLYGIGGAVNALTFTTKELGDVTIVGPGAGKRETGYSILTDILTITRQK